MEQNSDFRYDLKIGQEAEGYIGKLLTGSTLEVKMDFGFCKTGNFYIEYKSRGKWSGLATTEAQFYVLVGLRCNVTKEDIETFGLNPEFILNIFIIPVERLKAICKMKGVKQNIKGGDADTSVGCLVPYYLLSSYQE